MATLTAVRHYEVYAGRPETRRAVDTWVTRRGGHALVGPVERQLLGLLRARSPEDALEKAAKHWPTLRARLYVRTAVVRAL